MADSNITEEKIKSYFANFRIEQLTKDERNKQLLDSFCTNDYGASLESYLKNDAWKEDLGRHTKVYLIKNDENQIVAYFSLKCGLLYEPRYYDVCSDDEQMVIDSILEALDDKNYDDLQNCKEASIALFGDKHAERLFKCAQEQRDFQQKLMSVEEKSFNVEICHPAIELSHFCKTKDLIKTIGEIPFGVGVFWELIVPLVINIADTVGCKYLYLFAADQSKSAMRKLVDHYRMNLKFKNDTNLFFVKPKYDMGCRCLCQSIMDLDNSRKWIWQQFTGDL